MSFGDIPSLTPNYLFYIQLAVNLFQDQTVEFVLTPDDMAFCRKDMEFAQEPGEFKVWIGDSSDAALEGVFVVK